MKTVLSREHRKLLETTVAQAHVHAEAGAEKPSRRSLSPPRKLRPTPASQRKSSACACVRMAGRWDLRWDLLRPDDTQAIDHLVTEIAYEHWQGP